MNRTWTSPRHALAFLASLILLACAVAALAVPGVASASACGDKVLADWFDNGRIDRIYPLNCYEEAIDSIPADLVDYTNVQEVISRALAAATSGDLDPGGQDPTPRGPAEPSDPTDSDPGAPTDPGSGSTGSGSEVTPDVDTSGPSSVPIPLLLLVGMSIALLGAGGLGYLSRRRNAVASNDALDVGNDDLGG